MFTLLKKALVITLFLVGLVATTAICIWIICLFLTTETHSQGMIMENTGRFWWVVVLTPLIAFYRAQTAKSFIKIAGNSVLWAIDVPFRLLEFVVRFLGKLLGYKEVAK